MKNNNLNVLVVEAASDEDKMEKLIADYEPFILKCAASSAHKYVTKSDDEWSIALHAFSEAVHDYNLKKGGFLSFVELVIHRRMTDWLRTKMRHKSELTVNPILFDSESNEEETQPALQAEVMKKIAFVEQTDLQMEIQTANQCFFTYGFSFFDLTDCSPKAEKTKKSCAKAVAYLLKNPLLFAHLRATKLLPIKIIEKNAKVPRKILDRHRKYIIAAVEILSGDYPGLADYMRFIREELDK